jgi:hypothetical protein
METGIMTDILADIDDTLADWHGSADSMRWRPEGSEEPQPAHGWPSSGGTVTERVIGIVETAWYDQDGARITEDTARSDREAGRSVTFGELHETESGFRFLALQSIIGHEQPPESPGTVWAGLA